MALNANSFGEVLVAHGFGESHGPALGVVIEGCPSGLVWNQDLLIRNLNRRRPGNQSDNQLRLMTPISQRNEQDKPQILSGVYQGKTLGTPIALLVQNKDARSEDYSEILQNPRLGHADEVWKSKFGHVDGRGGGRASGRETVSRVLAGSVAQMLVQTLSPQTNVLLFLSQMGPIKMDDKDYSALNFLNQDEIENFPCKIPNVELSKQALNLLEEAQREGKSYGGEVEVCIKNPPKGLGQPVFHKWKADLASSVFSLGAVYHMEMGRSFDKLKAEGSVFHQKGNESYYGGILGGITTGDAIRFRLSFKPTATVLHQAQKGRHDPCVAIRALVVVESMIYHLLADHLLWKRLDRLEF